jgi:predicted nucleotidyltransferase
MDMLAEILSSKGRSEFFRLLFGMDSPEFHLRDIERRSKLAIGTVRQEAAKLSKLGLVRMRRDGNRTYYSANKEHPLYRTVHELVLKTSGLCDTLRPSLTNEDISFAFVFGSVAAGEVKAESDLDLFVIGDIGLRALSKLLREPCRQIGREINSHVMTREEFIERKTAKEHFVAGIVESPKLMIIGDEDGFGRLGQ